jgi:hypothetical protein
MRSADDVTECPRRQQDKLLKRFYWRFYEIEQATSPDMVDANMRQ